MTEHWYVESDSYGPYICERGTGRIATIECQSFASNGGREDWYRARLIRSAPQLRDALRNLLDAIRNSGWDMSDIFHDKYDKGIEALEYIKAKSKNA
jgi:hypothetical protein